MRPSGIALLLLLLASLPGVVGQDTPKVDPKYDVQRCTPKVVNERERKAEMRKRMEKPIRVRKGDKPTGIIPVVAFEILESGEVANLRIEQTSGIADQDAFALQAVRAFRYNSRSGCGVLESEVAITIDFFAESPSI